MSGIGRHISWGSLFRCMIGGMLLMLVAVNAFVGAVDWVLSLLLAGAGVAIMVGGQRVFRTAINREPEAIVCRYVPWYEAGPYVGVVFVALTGICGVLLGFRADSSPMFGVLGIGLLALTPVVLSKFLRGQQRCLLQIKPTTLGVPLPKNSYAMAEIPRGLIQSIEPVGETVGFGSTTLLVAEITYSPDSSVAQPLQTVRVGPAPATDTVWLTVEPSNLLAALQMWREANPDDPAALDRIETVLRQHGALRPLVTGRRSGRSQLSGYQ